MNTVIETPSTASPSFIVTSCPATLNCPTSKTSVNLAFASKPVKENDPASKDNLNAKPRSTSCPVRAKLPAFGKITLSTLKLTA